MSEEQIIEQLEPQHEAQHAPVYVPEPTPMYSNKEKPLGIPEASLCANAEYIKKEEQQKVKVSKGEGSGIVVPKV